MKSYVDNFYICFLDVGAYFQLYYMAVNEQLLCIDNNMAEYFPNTYWMELTRSTSCDVHKHV